jgi:hypothetical protein
LAVLLFSQNSYEWQVDQKNSAAAMREPSVRILILKDDATLNALQQERNKEAQPSFIDAQLAARRDPQHVVPFTEQFKQVYGLEQAQVNVMAQLGFQELKDRLVPDSRADILQGDVRVLSRAKRSIQVEPQEGQLCDPHRLTPFILCCSIVTTSRLHLMTC